MEIPYAQTVAYIEGLSYYFSFLLCKCEHIMVNSKPFLSNKYVNLFKKSFVCTLNHKQSLLYQSLTVIHLLWHFPRNPAIFSFYMVLYKLISCSSLTRVSPLPMPISACSCNLMQNFYTDIYFLHYLTNHRNWQSSRIQGLLQNTICGWMKQGQKNKGRNIITLRQSRHRVKMHFRYRSCLK